MRAVLQLASRILIREIHLKVLKALSLQEGSIYIKRAIDQLPPALKSKKERFVGVTFLPERTQHDYGSLIKDSK